MRKRIIMILSMLTIFSIVGCDGDIQIKDDIEIINQYFEYMNTGDVDGLHFIMDSSKRDRKRTVQYLKSVEADLDINYGEQWLQQYRKDKISLYDGNISEYEAYELVEDEDTITVSVKGKYRSWSTYDTSTMFIYEDPNFAEYCSDLQDIYNEFLETSDEEAYNNAYCELLNANAEAYFSAVIKHIQTLPMESFDMTFVLTKEEEGVTINMIKGDIWQGIAPYGETYQSYLEEPIRYKVDYEKTKAENTLLKKGNLRCDKCNTKNKYTPFEFLDYNITNAEGEEVSEDYILNASNGYLKFEVEVSGEVGNTFVMVISDSDGTILAEEEMYLLEEHRIFTKEITDYDTTVDSIYMYLYLLEDYEDWAFADDAFGWTSFKNQ